MSDSFAIRFKNRHGVRGFFKSERLLSLELSIGGPPLHVNVCSHKILYSEEMFALIIIIIIIIITIIIACLFYAYVAKS